MLLTPGVYSVVWSHCIHTPSPLNITEAREEALKKAPWVDWVGWWWEKDSSPNTINWSKVSGEIKKKGFRITDTSSDSNHWRNKVAGSQKQMHCACVCAWLGTYRVENTSALLHNSVSEYKWFSLQFAPNFVTSTLIIKRQQGNLAGISFALWR